MTPSHSFPTRLARLGALLLLGATGFVLVALAA